ncbi:MAG: F0F1 ATP synthase subunit B, partial [Alphaproteobacteria bacterium]
MFNETFWIAVAFVLFFVLFGKKIGGVLIGKLDERSDRIRNELDEAVRLR